MGGWVCVIGDGERSGLRSERLRRVFTIEGMPSLKLESLEPIRGYTALLWAWNPYGIPDVFLRKEQGTILLASGAITDLGDKTALPPTQEEVAQRILGLFLREGDRVVNQINGSFSLVFHDHGAGRTTIFVDRFASRPVWIGRDGNASVIGNFPSAMAAVKNESPRLNPGGLWSFFHAGRQVGSQGLYSGFRALMAGQKAVVERNGQVEILRWWKREYRPEPGFRPVRWGERVAEAVTNSAGRYRNISKSPHLFLSGGLDSRIAAAAWGKPLRTLSLCTQPNAETRIASRVARILGLSHLTIVRSPYWYHDTMSVSALIGSGLYLSQHAHFIRPVEQILGQDQDAEFLLGDLLENFNKHYFSPPERDILVFTPEAALEVLYRRAPYRINRLERLGKHFNKDIRGAFERSYRASLTEYVSQIRDVSDDPEDCYDTFFRWANIAVTPTFNMFTCIRALAKERNVCLDNQLTDVSLRIPARLRGKGVLHRWILYNLNKKVILIPDANTFLPPVVIPKARLITKQIRPWLGKLRRGVSKAGAQGVRLQTSGSWLLLHELYRKDDRYRRQIESLIFDQNLLPPDIFDHDEIKRTWTDYLGGDISLHFDVEALRSFASLQSLIPSGGVDY
jgi:hypothetical protein